MIVFSQAAFDRELKTLAKSQAREQDAAEKEWRKVCQPVFNCQEDAEAACQQFNQRWKYHQVSAEVIPITKHAHPGRPSAGAEPDVVRYALTGSVKSSHPGVEDAKLSLGKFILATNEMDSQNLSAMAMFDNYTAQGTSVERGFRFLIDPLFLPIACSSKILPGSWP